MENSCHPMADDQGSLELFLCKTEKNNNKMLHLACADFLEGHWKFSAESRYAFLDL